MSVDWASVRNVLVVRLDNIGDVVMTSPVLRAIKEAAPQARLTLLASPGGAQAAPLLPWLDDVLVHRALWQDLGRLPFDPARELAFVGELRSRSFDVALILSSFSQSPHPAAFACAMAGVPQRLGESKERGHALTLELPSASDDLHQAERNLRLLEAGGLSVRRRDLEVRVPQGAYESARALLAQRGVAGPYLLLNPWTSCQARTYPPERFARAARLLSEGTGLPVVVTGAAKDFEASLPLLEELGTRGVNLVGETELTEFAAVVAGASLVLTGNTSALHLADALSVPVVCLYSGTELDSQWEPRQAPHQLLRRPTPCSPCYAFTCPFDRECLDFSPGEVAQAAQALLSRLSRPHEVAL